MQLPSFITHSLAFFKSAEEHQKKVEAALGSASTAQAEVVRLTSELTSAQTATAAANADLLAARNSLALAETAKATAEAAAAASDAKATKAEADLAALAANPSEQARRILASTGSLPAPKAKVDVTEKTMSRAEFNALDHSARNAFMRSGGKISDSN